MVRPAHILSPPDVCDPNFAAQSRLWTDQIKREIHEAIATTRRTIAESEAIMMEIDRVLAPK